MYGTIRTCGQRCICSKPFSLEDVQLLNSYLSNLNQKWFHSGRKYSTGRNWDNLVRVWRYIVADTRPCVVDHIMVDIACFFHKGVSEIVFFDFEDNCTGWCGVAVIWRNKCTVAHYNRGSVTRGPLMYLNILKSLPSWFYEKSTSISFLKLVEKVI